MSRDGEGHDALPPRTGSAPDRGTERSARRILVVEDDDAISFGLRTNLEFEGYAVQIARTREAAIARAREAPPDLIVLDLMLPDGSGFEVMQALARLPFDGLILVLSARKEETDKVSALRMGADDYVVKPFSLAELLARIEALLRRQPPARARGRAAPVTAVEPGVAPTPSTDARHTPEPPPRDEASGRIRFGRCEIDVGARVLRRDGAEVSLTRLEFDLLLYLAQNAGRALSRGQLLREVWGLSHDGSARTVDNVVAHLRTKIAEDTGSPRHLFTLRGAGYRFELGAEPPRGPDDA